MKLCHKLEFCVPLLSLAIKNHVTLVPGAAVIKVTLLVTFPLAVDDPKLIQLEFTNTDPVFMLNV